MAESDLDSEPNLEHDLHASDRIRAKAQDPVYAQHLYAALCNNQFQRRELWPVLSDHKWGCSWRYAGGVVAELQGVGNYMDWYCSGIGFHPIDGDVDDAVDQDSTEYQQMRQYVDEGVITAEIAADLASLNWYSVPFDPLVD
jgi:hypothetical protein